MLRLIWLAIRKMSHNYNLWILGGVFAGIMILCAVLGLGVSGFFWMTYIGWKLGAGFGAIINLIIIGAMVDYELRGRRSAEGMTMWDAYKERG